MEESPSTELLNDCSLLLEYSTGFKVKIWFLITSCFGICGVLSTSWIMKHLDDVPDKQTIWFFALITFFGWAAIYSISYLPKSKKRIIVTKDFIRFGDEEIRWKDLTKVWNSIVFSMLTIKTDEKKMVFHTGLIGYEFIAGLSKEKLKANQALQTTSASARRLS